MPTLKFWDGAAWVPVDAGLPQPPDNSITSAKIADGTIARTDMQPALQSLLTAPYLPSDRIVRTIASTVSVGGGGWATVPFPFGFTMAVVDLVMVIPSPAANGAALSSWSLASFTLSSVSLFLYNSALQNVTAYGFVIGKP